MKKIGIMSMQRICNYGSFLQSYALKILIEELGCNVEFVDYHVKECKMKQNDGFSIIIQKSDKLVKYLGLKTSFINKAKFILFKKNYGRKNYPILGVGKKKNYQPKLDVLVIGSDEVFNCIQSNPDVGYSTELFGEKNNAKKLISYAASFGNTTIEKITKYKVSTEIGDLLSKFDYISVRDKNSYEIVRELTKKTPCYNIDPVLAYDYMNKCTEIPNDINDKNYIILYGYSGRITSEECKVIKEFAKTKNKKIYCIGGIQECCDKFINCSPFEVLAYFKKSDLIITDTFHGSIFSIITKKKFVTLIRKSTGNSYGNEEKLTDLLERMKLTNRIIEDINDLEKYFNMDIDYTSTYKILENERENAKKYLQSNIL